MMLYTTRPSSLPSPPTSSPVTSPTLVPTDPITSTHSTSPPPSPPSISEDITEPTSKTTTVIISSQRGRTPKHADIKTGSSVTVTVKPVRSCSVSSTESDINMVKRKERRDASCDSRLSAVSLPAPTRDLTRPPTPTSPVQIPKQGNHARHHNLAHPLRRNNSHGGYRRRVAHVHSPDSLSPSMAALLAVTDIPRPRSSQRKVRKPLTVDAIISNEKELSEKELSLTFSRGYPMDMLLSPPESLEDEDGFGDNPMFACSMTRTLSVDSMPSLGDSFGTDVVSSIDSPRSQSPAPARRRMMSPIRKSLEPIRSPPDSIDEHPLAMSTHDADELDFVTIEKPESEEIAASSTSPFKPLKAVFKSNLTASLRALRSAAKSFSGISFPSIPPDDFLTRSILTMDPKVPFTDERRPPVTEEMPSAELRRYLNPTTRLSLETQPGTLPKPKFSASIQMQTYKIQRSRPTSPRGPFPSVPKSQSPATSKEPTEQSPDRAPAHVPGMRQREMRENPDFIRIAVMEMAMRRRGKLDNNKPGRARWALPPRKTSMKPYEIGTDGVPERWIPITC
ncbi:hypothetical protein PT974_02927 [Cladobotryum mycophilum]|uniref:Uncharacterized protein n=1 Tax=Cladobotryum mycophilum TaxID=491253 RepID=A0ABR0T010_9HYPO